MVDALFPEPAETREPSAVEQLHAAAHAVREAIVEDPLCSVEVGEAIADLLDTAAVAWPIDGSEAPRNPRDRHLAYKALGLARAYTQAVA